MPNYFIKAVVYATYEYSNVAEIEADSAEEAGKKFEALVGQRANGIIDLSVPISDPFDIGGNYNVYAMLEDSDTDDLTDEEPEIECASFSGRE